LIPILWQSDSAIAAHKPAGLSTTSPPGTDSLEWKLRQQLGRDTGFLSAVHRLDREVSGIVLVALSKKTARLLSEQFETRKVKKTYHAWVSGRVDASHIPVRWSDHVCKLENVPRGEVCDANAPGAKIAETDVTVLRYNAEGDCTLIELSPITGRMHQLRLQTAARGHVILGDPVYGTLSSEASEHRSPTDRAPTDRSWTGPSLALIAMQIQFHHPKTGAMTEVKIPGFPVDTESQNS